MSTSYFLRRTFGTNRRGAAGRKYKGQAQSEAARAAPGNGRNRDQALKSLSEKSEIAKNRVSKIIRRNRKTR
jgi:hypothetical protein